MIASPPSWESPPERRCCESPGFLQEVCGISPYMDLTDLRPLTADAFLADIFQVPQGTPLLNMDEVDYDIDGVPVFVSSEYFADGIFRHTVLRKKL